MEYGVVGPGAEQHELGRLIVAAAATPGVPLVQAAATAAPCMVMLGVVATPGDPCTTWAVGVGTATRPAPGQRHGRHERLRALERIEHGGSTKQFGEPAGHGTGYRPQKQAGPQERGVVQVFSEVSGRLISDLGMRLNLDASYM